MSRAVPLLVLSMVLGACASSGVGFPEGAVIAVHSASCVEVADQTGSSFGLLPDGWQGDVASGAATGPDGATFAVGDVITGSARSQPVDTDECGPGVVPALRMTDVQVR